MAISIQTEPEVRRRAEEGKGPSHRQANGNVPFRYVYDPHAWTFYPDTGEFLPMLRELRLDPGVNGVDKSQSERPIIAAATEKRWLWLDPEDKRLGEFRNYCVSLRNDKGQKHHFSIFQGPRMVGNRLHWLDADDPAAAERARKAGEDVGPAVGRYREFLRFLVAEGIVPDIDDAVREEMIERQRGLLNDRVQRLGMDPQNRALKEKVEADRLGLEAMRRGVPVAEVMADEQAYEKPAKTARGRGKKAEDAEA